MLLRSGNASQRGWRRFWVVPGIVCVAILGTFGGLVQTAQGGPAADSAAAPGGTSASGATVASGAAGRSADQQAVIDQEKSVLQQVDQAPDGDARFALYDGLSNDYFKAGLVADSMRIREKIVDDSHISAGHRSLTASGLAAAYANEYDFARSKRLIDEAKDLAGQTAPAELETLSHEPSYAYLTAEAEIARRDLNQHDIALFKLRECAELASKNLADPSLSERRHRAAANQLLDGIDELVRLQVQNNRRTEALSYVNGMLWDIDHRPDLKPTPEQRARVDFARAIALCSNDDYDGALASIDRAIKGFRDAGLPPHSLTYSEAVRMRLMIGLATNWAAGGFKDDADAYEHAASVNPVAARSESANERESLILAARGSFPDAEARISKAIANNLRRQGPESPFYKYQSAMLMLYRLEDSTAQVSENEIARYVTPLVGQSDDWDDSSTRGSYVEDGALAMCLKRLMDGGASGQALAFRIAELFHMNATQGAMSDGAARLAASTPQLRGLIEQEQSLRREQSSDRFALAKAMAHQEGLSTQDGLTRNRAESAVSDADKTLNASNEQLHKLHAQIASQFPEYRQLVSPSIPTPEQLGAALHGDEVYVNLYSGRDASYAFVVDSHSALHAVKLDATRADIRKQIVALRKSFDAGVPPRKPGDLGGFDLASAASLYQALIAAIQPSIQGAATVYIATSGVLSSLPFDVLVTSPAPDLASAKWWIGTTMPVRIPSASALVLARSHPATHANQPLVAFADPSFVGSASSADAQGASAVAARSAFPVDDSLTTLSFNYHRVTPLPDTLNEARAIATALGASDQSVVSGMEATRSAVMKANLADDRVVLFATHGIVPGQVPGWRKSGLAMTYEGRGLADSILTSDDIVTLRLNADWAVLSACNTGLATGNAGDSISELSRAFFAAGARSVLVTQWSVESRSATEITTQLFKNYSADSSLSKAQALAQTERDMLSGKDGPLFQHPYFWGAYVLAGDGAR